MQKGEELRKRVPTVSQHCIIQQIYPELFPSAVTKVKSEVNKSFIKR